MKSITTNKLQSDLSKVIKEVEDGEIYQVSRYSKPVALIISQEKFDELSERANCKKCVEDLRKIANKVNE